MFVVGVTGGIGSGKSTVAALLAERGAQVIDADELGRDALRPGRPAWHSVVDTFGDEILRRGSMEIERGRLADIVFNDLNKLTALNAIVHPVILRGIADHLERLSSSESVVVIDAALLVELGLVDLLDALLVVTASRGQRRERLVLSRGLRPEDVDARMAAQAPEKELVAKADLVVRNDGDLDRLVSEVDRVWEEIGRLQAR